MNIFTLSLRLCALSLPVFLAGASCGPIRGSCEPVFLECADGQDAIDTDGDGCVDSCAPIAICLAFPVCGDGETEVNGPGECLQDDAICYENTVCGSTIWCTGPGTDLCVDDADCGDRQYCNRVDCDDLCKPGLGTVCEEDCMGFCSDTVIVPPLGLECADGEVENDFDNDGDADWCEPEGCTDQPLCFDGHSVVSGPIDCEQGGGYLCYERTSCRTTIWCTGPDAILDG